MIRRRYRYLVRCHRPEEVFLRSRSLAVPMKHVDEPVLTRIFVQRVQERASQEGAAEQNRNISRDVSDHLQKS